MFPEELVEQGLTEEVLFSTLTEIQVGNSHLWELSSIPSIGFYRALHTYLKRHSKVTKTLIGKFYATIDGNFREKGSRPDNLYQFVERITSSRKQSDESMVYEVQAMKVMKSQLRKCHDQINELHSDCAEIRKQFEISGKKLRAATLSLHDMTKENESLKRKYELTKLKADKLKNATELLNSKCTKLQVENLELLYINDSDNESCDADTSYQSGEADKLEDIVGDHHKYSPEIRMLYYSLLANQIPASKIADIIREVLACFNPTMNMTELRLPKKSCASYMRNEELTTISNCHKASILCSDSIKTKGIFLNTDGTTKHQRKLGGVVASDVVLGVNELPDGKAISAIEDISREFEKLRKVAHILGLPNPNSINWTLVVSSSSDSAATQKRINKLIEEQRQSDEKKFGHATVKTIDLIETFCSMHLGVNLRKAFLSGTMESDDDESNEQKYHRVDTLVHEFCKLFGRTGVPEYASGVVSFPDFVELKISSDDENNGYYKSCSEVSLHRQVGSRYFVSAANGCKILFLRDAAIEYLKFTGKDSGNRLERDVFTKLHDSVELAHLKADSLMYYHVYGDLYMLSKSNDLGLSVMSMNQHYLELKTFLLDVESNPDIVFDSSYRVFPSEKRLYEKDNKVNHRLKSPAVYLKLFDKISSANLKSLLIKGASKMREKLCSYAQSQLPGGCYWDADPEVKDVLCQLKPSNDVCESILGLNDYLTTAIPNLNQMARSNLVQVKKNKTLKWLSDLPKKDQCTVLLETDNKYTRSTEMKKD